MGIFSKFENKMEDAIDDLGDKFFDSPISPVQIAKKAEKQMRRNKMLGAGKQFAPTLYTVLVNANDDARLFGYYPTLAGETETYLKAKANESGLAMDGDPLVRFIVDNDLKAGKFDVIAEPVAADIITQLRAEEMERYGINNQNQPVVSQTPQQAAAEVAAQAQVNPTPQVSTPQNVSSPFAPFEEVPAQGVASPAPAVQNTPVPQPTPAPQPTPVPQATPAPVEVPVQEPKQAEAVGGNANPVPVSSAKTAVFAGNFDTPNANAAPQQNAAIPPAHLMEQTTGRVYTLNAATVVIGRENTCNIVLPDANASRQHAQITYNQGLWLCNDLGSTNGTFVNNQEITTREIHPGDVITIGVTKLTFNVG